MNERDDEKLRALLKRTIPPTTDAQLERDLWPAILRRIEERSIRVPWVDWALGALLIALLLFFPEVISFLLYQL